MLGIALTSLRLAAALFPRSRVLRRLMIGALAIAVGFIGYQGYIWLHASKGRLSPDQTAAVRTAVSQAIDEFAAKGGALPARAAVLHLRNDPTDRATEIVREELERREGWTVVSSSPVRAFLESIAGTMNDATSADELLRPGSRVGIDVIFHGTVADISTTNGVSRGALSLSAYDTRVGATTLSEDCEAEYPKVQTEAGRAVIRHPRSLRIWLFAIFALLLPWICAPVVYKVREAKSNSASAILLAALLVLDALVGSALFFALSGRVVTVAVVLLICLLYNLVVCEALSRRA